MVFDPPPVPTRDTDRLWPAADSGAMTLRDMDEPNAMFLWCVRGEALNESIRLDSAFSFSHSSFVSGSALGHNADNVLMTHLSRALSAANFFGTPK